MAEGDVRKIVEELPKEQDMTGLGLSVSLGIALTPGGGMDYPENLRRKYIF